MLRILVICLFVVNLLLFAFWDRQPEVQSKTASKPAAARKSNIPTIHLFSEMMENQALMSDSRQCFSLGPFHSIDDVDEVYASLLDVTVAVTERQTQALVEKGYWVYLAPYKDLVEANQVLFSLQALGLEDSAVVYNGEWSNGISLGYFRRQENAVKRKKGLEDRGYTPLIRVRRAAEDRFWLDYEKAPGSGMIALDIQNRPNDFMQRAMPCAEQQAPVKQPVEQQIAVQTPLPPPTDEPEQEQELVQVVEEVIEANTEEATPPQEQAPEPIETEISLPADDDPVPVEPELQQQEPQQQGSDELPLVGDSRSDSEQSEEPLSTQTNAPALNNREAVVPVEINQAYLLQNIDTSPVDAQQEERTQSPELPSAEVDQTDDEQTIYPPNDALDADEIIPEGGEETSPEQDDDTDPYDGDEIEIDAS